MTRGCVTLRGGRGGCAMARGCVKTDILCQINPAKIVAPSCGPCARPFHTLVNNEVEPGARGKVTGARGKFLY